MSEVVRYEVTDSVAWLTMARPQARNALNAALRRGLLDGFQQFQADPEAAVLVLAGEGEAFCAGGDLKEMAETGLQVPQPDYVPQPGRTVQMDKPSFAAVNGAAYGGGFLLAQSCDLCIAAEDARFAISEARWGRGAPWAAPLPWLIPPRIALQMLLTAEPLSAERAHQVGLVNQVVPPGELHAAAAQLASRIAANAPLSVRAGKAMVYASAEHPRSKAYEHAERLFATVYLSDDAQEGPRAFQEKRPPVWQGR